MKIHNAATLLLRPVFTVKLWKKQNKTKKQTSASGRTQKGPDSLSFSILRINVGIIQTEEERGKRSQSK